MLYKVFIPREKELIRFNATLFEEPAGAKIGEGGGGGNGLECKGEGLPRWESMAET